MNIRIYVFLPMKIHKISTANIEVYEAIQWNWYMEAQLLQKVTYLRLFIMHVLMWAILCCNIHLLISEYACHDMRYVCMVEINIFLSKHVQILMFVFSIFLFFSPARYDIMHLNFAFYSKTMSTCGIVLWAFFNTSSDEPGYAGFKRFWWNTVFFKLCK